MYVFAVMFEIKGACLYSCVSYGKDRFVKLRNVHYIVKHRLLWTHCLETAISLLPWIRSLRACRCKEKTFYDVNYNSCTMRAPLIVRIHVFSVESSFSGEVSSQYRSGTVNSKSFVGKFLLRIKRKFELTYAL